jgi:hypothetical protein
MKKGVIMSRIQPLQDYNYVSYRNNYNKNKKPVAFNGAATEAAKDVVALTKDEENIVSKVLTFITGKILL